MRLYFQLVASGDAIHDLGPVDGLGPDENKWIPKSADL